MNTGYSKFLLPLVFVYRPSKSLLYFLILMHGATLPGLAYAGIDPRIAVVCGILVIWSLLRYTIQHCSRSGVGHGNRFILSPDNDWWMLDRNGKGQLIKQLRGSVVHPWLVIIRFKCEQDRCYALILTRDNLEADVLRRLRVRLRYAIAK
jgi:hypothetical protein